MIRRFEMGLRWFGTAGSGEGFIGKTNEALLLLSNDEEVMIHLLILWKFFCWTVMWKWFGEATDDDSK
jgi:hypothetical protein